MCIIETHKFSVFYLAGEFVRHLQRQAQDDFPENLFTDGDVICVQIAGLCHDLGKFSTGSSRYTLDAIYRASAYS